MRRDYASWVAIAAVTVAAACTNGTADSEPPGPGSSNGVAGGANAGSGGVSAGGANAGGANAGGANAGGANAGGANAGSNAAGGAGGSGAVAGVPSAGGTSAGDAGVGGVSVGGSSGAGGVSGSNAGTSGAAGQSGGAGVSGGAAAQGGGAGASGMAGVSGGGTAGFAGAGAGGIGGGPAGAGGVAGSAAGAAGNPAGGASGNGGSAGAAGSSAGAAGSSAGAAGTGGTSACASPQVRITEIDVGANINVNENDADSKPVMLSPIPSGGSRMSWTGSDGKVHVTTLNADDTVNTNIGTVNLMGMDVGDIYADNTGGVVLVTRNADGSGGVVNTLNCGDPSNLCGTPPNPAIPCYDMYLVRFDGTSETWATKLTQTSAAHPGYLNSKTDNQNVIFIWWYAHQGRIVSDGTNYAGYFGAAISVTQAGCVNIHQGDEMKVVSPAGAVLTGHQSFDWGCSHSGYERIVWDPKANKFVTVCKNDAPTGGKSGRLAFAPNTTTIYPLDLYYSNMGNITLGGGGGYWLSTSDIRAGQTANMDGLADVHL
ncbi:MAG TPA: hypothetical protein VGI10_17670, partial [Polyangiaceae bacterium]